MRIIDDKGRLFGKINVIDLLAIIFLLSLTPVFYFGYKIFIKKPPVPATVLIVPRKEFVEIKINLDLINLTPDIAKAILVGDNEKDIDGKVIASIMRLSDTLPQIYEFDTGEGNKIFKEDDTLKHMLATLKITAEKRGGRLYYKDKPIIVNSPIGLVIKDYEIEAVLAANKRKDSVGEIQNIQIKSEIDSLKNEISIIKLKLYNIEYLVQEPYLDKGDKNKAGK